MIDKPKIIKRGRLDILQDLTERGAEWRLETDPKPPPIPAIRWMQASVRGRSKEFYNIRRAIDWIIEQYCQSEC